MYLGMPCTVGILLSLLLNVSDCLLLLYNDAVIIIFAPCIVTRGKKELGPLLLFNPLFPCSPHFSAFTYLYTIDIYAHI
jgi:hypothetical protein